MKGRKFVPIFIALIPVMYMTAFAIYPFLWLIYYSFHTYLLGKEITFCAFSNYMSLFKDSVFLYAVYITFFYMIVATIIEFGIGLFMAYFIYKIIRGKGVYLTLILIPLIMTPAVSGIIWKTLFDPAYGHINIYLGYLGFPGLKWLVRPTLAFISALIVDIWQWTPFIILSVFAGFSAVRRDIIEAAYVDGASERTLLKDIMIPYVKPLIVIILLLRFLDSLKIFDAIFTLTRGGPGFETMVLSVLAYIVTFTYRDIGRASAIGVILWMFCFLLGTFFMRKYGDVMWG